MPWETPPLKQIRSLVRDNIRSALPGADASIPNSVLRILSDAQGALAHLVLQYIDWLALQLLPDTAEHEWLDRHGDIWLVNADGTKGRKRATLAHGTVAVTGSAGVTLPAALQLLPASASEISFETTATMTLAAGSTVVPVRALDPGAAGNLAVGTALSFADPPLGVDGAAEVLGLFGGADEETDEQLRARILQRIQQPPMGGDATDYEAWAMAVPGVTRAWCSPLEMGIGTVTVRFMMDELRASNHGFPLAEDVAVVAAYLETQRPVAVKDFFVAAPIPFPIALHVDELYVDSPSTRVNIETSLNDMLFARAAPGETVYRSWVEAAVSDAIGEDHHELGFETTAMPSPGHLAILGSVIYAGG